MAELAVEWSHEHDTANTSCRYAGWRRFDDSITRQAADGFSTLERTAKDRVLELKGRQHSGTVDHGRFAIVSCLSPEIRDRKRERGDGTSSGAGSG